MGFGFLVLVFGFLFFFLKKKKKLKSCFSIVTNNILKDYKISCSSCFDSIRGVDTYRRISVSFFRWFKLQSICPVSAIGGSNICCRLFCFKLELVSSTRVVLKLSLAVSLKTAVV